MHTKCLMTSYAQPNIKSSIGILANLQRRPLKLGRLIVLQETPTAITISVLMPTHSFPVPTHLILICMGFSAPTMLNEATHSS